jgi:hypothetical protein
VDGQRKNPVLNHVALLPARVAFVDEPRQIDADKPEYDRGKPGQDSQP